MQLLKAASAMPRSEAAGRPQELCTNLPAAEPFLLVLCVTATITIQYGKAQFSHAVQRLTSLLTSPLISQPRNSLKSFFQEFPSSPSCLVLPHSSGLNIPQVLLIPWILDQCADRR